MFKKVVANFRMPILKLAGNWHEIDIKILFKGRIEFRIYLS